MLKTIALNRRKSKKKLKGKVQTMTRAEFETLQSETRIDATLPNSEIYMRNKLVLTSGRFTLPDNPNEAWKYEKEERQRVINWKTGMESSKKAHAVCQKMCNDKFGPPLSTLI